MDDAKLGINVGGSSTRRKIFKLVRACRRRHACMHALGAVQPNLYIVASHGCCRRCRDPFRLDYGAFLPVKAIQKGLPSANLICHWGGKRRHDHVWHR